MGFKRESASQCDEFYNNLRFGIDLWKNKKGNYLKNCCVTVTTNGMNLFFNRL